MLIPRTRPFLKVLWVINRLWNGLWYSIKRVGTCSVPVEGPVILTANHGSTADPMMLTTSVPGIYAAGDLTTRAQGALFAAAAGTRAAAALVVDIALDHAHMQPLSSPG